jgi:hypothetical protein
VGQLKLQHLGLNPACAVGHVSELDPNLSPLSTLEAKDPPNTNDSQIEKFGRENHCLFLSCVLEITRCTSEMKSPPGMVSFGFYLLFTRKGRALTGATFQAPAEGWWPSATLTKKKKNQFGTFQWVTFQCVTFQCVTFQCGTFQCVTFQCVTFIQK